MDLVQTALEPIRFISSPQSDRTDGSPVDNDLLRVTYKRAQKESPEFNSVFEGIDQSVDIHISTFIFRAAPEPVLALYDFIMTTFVPKPTTPAVENAPEAKHEDHPEEIDAIATGKIRVDVKLASIQSRSR